MEATTGLDADVIKRIQNTRKELLDLSARNRLISTPRGSAQGRKIEVVDERSEEVFRLLVRERKGMSFLPGEGEEEDDTSALQLAQPEDATVNGTPDPRHTDLRLQTRLQSERLQGRLLAMYYDAQTYEQEQGVSILYMALGFLKWFESASSDKPRYAPLLLVPVDLDRATAASRFVLRYREEEVTTNLSLQAKLHAEFGLALPDVPDLDELSPTAYFDAIARAVECQPRWEVLRDDIVLWFFSFAKYLMYRDLDPANWPEHAPLGSNPTLSSLLGDGFVSEPPICDDADKIDPLIPPTHCVHVTDADSSQAVVIEEVRRGRHLVVQGPPGTGKSQTITNLIATAVKEGKNVLFVAEKMAALDVVHGRLERLGLDSICLELHSHKANKKTVLQELARTLALGRPKVQGAGERLERLHAAIERLNCHAAVMNAPADPSGLTPYVVIGRLSTLYGRGVEASNLGITGLESWTAAQFCDRCRDVEDLETHLSALGAPGNHPWCGVTRTEPILHAERQAFLDNLRETIDSLATINQTEVELAEALGLPTRDASSLKDAQQLAQFAIRLVNAPPAIDRSRIAGTAWEKRVAEIACLVERGRALTDSRYRQRYVRLEELHDRLARVGSPRDHLFRGVRRADPIPRQTVSEIIALASETAASLEAVQELSTRLAEALGVEWSPEADFREIQQLAQLALRIVKAPRMDRSRLTQPIWDAGRERLVELVSKGEVLATKMAELGKTVADVAWQTDLVVTRRHLAGYGGSLFRWANRDYRAALVTLRGILKGEPPRALSERLALLDGIISAQASYRALEEDPSGRDAFGGEWSGAQSDWGRLAEIIAWDGDCHATRLAHAHRSVLAALDEPELCRDPLNALSARLRPSFDRLKGLLDRLELEIGPAFGRDSLLSVPIRVLAERLRRWHEHPDALNNWIEYQASRHRAEAAGVGDTVSAVHDGRTTVETALRELQSRFHEELEVSVASSGSETARGQHAVASDWLGPDAFGTCWKGIQSDWDALHAVVRWDRECRDSNAAWNHREHLARLDSLDPVRNSLRGLVSQLNHIPGRLQALFKTVELNVSETFARESALRVPIRDVHSRLQRWQDDSEGLSRWIGYQVRRKKLKEAGLAPLVDGLHDGRIPVSAALDQLQVSYYQGVVRDMFGRHSALAEFDGQTHEQWVEEFRTLDQARIELARGEVAATHYDAIPRHAVGEMAILRREFEKKRRHKPIRQLLREAGTAVQAIKPVFMMSPISVAQFLAPGSLTFDLLLIDEASQVSPVDALGAIARARQVVVVGDDKQLPPTRFFSKMLDDSATPDESDELNAGDLESVLGLCVAQGMSQRMLRWHYRSRHHSLIAVSNREFYENNLYVVPSPTTTTALHGLHFRHVKGGVFDRGNSATNRVEARMVAEAVIDHARRFPKKSLGVGAFSVSQRDAIRDELEVLQREYVELASFFSPGRPEPFFVKNLENIQGDERDVVFISVGYARDASGYMAMNFGPLSTEGGERRLNVLISRARERCEVISSITAEDIDLQRTRSRGAAAFKTFLRYAATGVLDTQAPTGGDFDSDFERQVARALESHGYEVHCQVGTAGFIVDLAVVDPTRPGRYLLGIECDGATYHSSRSARDRDRLREAVLRDRGWRIHRIWSTDWFHRPTEQIQKVIVAIEKARKEEEVDEDAQEDTSFDTPTSEEIERVEEAEEASEGHRWVVPYVEAAFEVPLGTPIHETSLSVLTEIVTRVVELEGPVHRDEVARRMTLLWGLQRTGARIAEAIERAARAGEASGLIRKDGDFLSHSQQATVPVRSRANVSSSGLKRPEMIPPSEICQAIRQFVAEHAGIRRDELTVMVARILGFKATSAKLRELIDGVVATCLESDDLALRDERMFRC